MATDVTMPRLSDSMEEGTILKWIVEEGGEVKRGEPLCEIETDKANMTYEADTDGTLIEIVVPEGETVALGQVIARVGEAGEEKQSGEGDEEQPAEDEEEAEAEADQEEEPEEEAEEERERATASASDGDEGEGHGARLRARGRDRHGTVRGAARAAEAGRGEAAVVQRHGGEGLRQRAARASAREWRLQGRQVRALLASERRGGRGGERRARRADRLRRRQEVA